MTTNPASPAAPDFGGVTVVFVGQKDLSLLHPAWFREKGLMSDDEARSARVTIVHPTAVEFSVPEAFSIRGDEERLIFSAEEPEWTETVRDLALGVIRELGATEFTSYGINKGGHWRLPAQKNLDQLLTALLPMAPLSFVKEASPFGVTVRGPGWEGYAGTTQVRIEASLHLSHAVFISQNIHFETRASGTTPPAPPEAILDKSWNDVMIYVDGIITNVLAYADQGSS